MSARVIIDVGAGKYTNYHRWLTENDKTVIYSFEPNIVLYNKLIQLRSGMLEGCSSRLHIYNMAVVNTNDTKVQYHISNDIGSSSTLPFVKENVLRWKYPIGKRQFETIDTISVDCISLERFFEDKKLLFVELLNIDTQGNGYDILDSLSHRRYSSIKSVQVKVHTIDYELYPGQSKYEDVVRYLKSRYYKLSSVQSVSRDQESVLTFQSETKGPAFPFKP